MQMGMIGLGKMGANMVRRWLRGGHEVVAFDRDAAAVASVVEEGAVGAAGMSELVEHLQAPRAVWVMVPAGAVTEQVIDGLAPILSSGDCIIDGGNTLYRDDVRRAAALRQNGIDYIDQGTSGGVWGLAEGYSLMIGGDAGVVERLRPAFETLAPAPDRGGRSRDKGRHRSAGPVRRVLADRARTSKW